MKYEDLSTVLTLTAPCHPKLFAPLHHSSPLTSPKWGAGSEFNLRWVSPFRRCLANKGLRSFESDTHTRKMSHVSVGGITGWFWTSDWRSRFLSGTRPLSCFHLSYWFQAPFASKTISHRCLATVSKSNLNTFPLCRRRGEERGWQWHSLCIFSGFSPSLPFSVSQRHRGSDNDTFQFSEKLWKSQMH